MNRIPVKNGKVCVFRVVRVSGTIRKAEEEAIRRARDIILKARREADEQSHSTLASIFGEGDNGEADLIRDAMMVDRSDSEDDEEELSDRGG
jgi:ribonuclease P/MRP protein subunit POP5